MTLYADDLSIYIDSAIERDELEEAAGIIVLDSEGRILGTASDAAVLHGLLMIEIGSYDSQPERTRRSRRVRPVGPSSERMREVTLAKLRELQEGA